MSQHLQTLAHPVTAISEPPMKAPTPAPGSLAHLFCDDHDYGDEEFLPAVMRACLARRALLVYGIFGRSDFFSADLELVKAVAHARTRDDVEEAIDEYWCHPANRRWLRHAGRLRISTQRLRRFADGYLSAETRRRPRSAARPA